MTPTQAKAFDAVAVEGSFTKAAKKLGVSQPTITTHVKQLETLCKVELFHRTSRGVKLTPTGVNLHQIVRRMFGCYDEAAGYLDEVAGLRRGHLRVGSYGPYDAMPMLARFRSDYPGITMSAVFANSSVLSRQILDYEIDVAVLGRSDYPDGFHVMPYAEPPLVVIAPADESWRGRKTIDPAELRHHHLLMRENGSAARTAFERILLGAGVAGYSFDEIGSREGVVSAVASGMGIGAVFDEGLLPVDRVTKLTIEGATPISPVDVVCLKERRGNPAIGAFLAIAEDLISRPRPAAPMSA